MPMQVKHSLPSILDSAPDRECAPRLIRACEQTTFVQAPMQGAWRHGQLIISVPPQPLNDSMGSAGLQVQVVAVQPADAVPLGSPFAALVVSGADGHRAPAPCLRLARRIPTRSSKMCPPRGESTTEQFQETSCGFARRLVVFLGHRRFS